MIIGITGKARHGKDTVANLLSEYIPSNIYHLANPMKESAKVFFNWTDEHVYGELKDTVDPEWGISPRHYLQWIGTEVFQFNLPQEFSGYDGGRGHWVKLMLSHCDNKVFPYYLIPDVRFVHEANAIKNSGGIILKVERDIKTNVPNHPSEREIHLIKEDYTFQNNLSINALREKVCNWVDYADFKGLL